MDLTFHGKASEIGENVLNSIKSMYGDKNVRIEVVEEMDTTEYLLSNPANAKHLMDAIDNVRKGNVVSFTLEEFEKLSNELLERK